MPTIHGRKVQLPHKYDIEIMELVGDGKTTTEISAILLKKYQLIANLNTLFSRIARLKKQNQTIASAALSQQVIKSAVNHTAIFEKNIRKLDAEIDACFKEGDRTVAATLMNTQLRIQQQHLSLLGLDKIVNDDDEVLKRLAGE